MDFSAAVELIEDRSHRRPIDDDVMEYEYKQVLFFGQAHQRRSEVPRYGEVEGSLAHPHRKRVRLHATLALR